MRRILSLTAALVLCGGLVLAQAPASINGTISAGGVDCSTATRCVVLPLGMANGTGLITVGTFTGTIAVEISPDNVSWTSPSGGTTSITTAGSYFTSLQGARWLRVRASTLSSGTPAIVLTATFTTFYGSVGVTGTATVAGTVTANAGTNLNTSTLAVETGGNLAAIKADADKIPSQGQALSAASMPVVLPSAQITTLTPLSTVTANLGTLNGAATAAGVAALEVTQGSTTSGQSGVLTQGAVTTSAPSYTTAQTAPLSLDPSGNLRVAVTGGGSNAAAGATGSAVPASASYTAYNSAGNLVGVSTANRFPVTCDNCGGGTGGTSATDNGTYTAGTSSGTPAMGALDDTGTTAATEDKLAIVRITAQRAEHVNLRTAAGVETGIAAAPLQVSLANTGANGNKLLVTPDSVALPANQSVNESQINGVTPLMGNGVTGTGSQRVTIASDNTAFSVNAVQSGIWTVQPGNTANSTAWLFAGGKTNNNAAPGATNVGALGFLANAAKPTWTEGNLVAGSVDLNGAMRATFLDSGGTSTTDTTAHAVKMLAVDTAGAAIVPTTLATHDAALTPASTTGGVLFGRASAAAPTAVTADDKAVIGWFDRRGALFTNPAFAGVLASTGTGAVGTGTQRIAVGTDTATIAGSAPGTAGSASSNVVTVQGVASMTKLLVTPDSVALPANQSVNESQINGVTPLMGNGVTGTGSQRVTIASDNTAFSVNATVSQGTGTNLHMVCDSGCSGSAGFADNSAFTYGTTAINPIGGVLDDVSTNTATENSAAIARITPQKALHVSLRTQAGVEEGVAATPLQVSLANTGANTNKLLVTPDSVALPANQSVNVSQINGVTPLMGAGNTGTGSPRVTISTDQAALTGFGVYVEDAPETAGGNLSMAGSVRRDTPASSAGSSGDNATLNTNATGALYTQETAGTAGGATPGFYISAASNNSTNLKASAGTVYTLTLINTTAALKYIRLYDLATAPTCTSATGIVFYTPIPASATGAGFVYTIAVGKAFSTGIGWCITGAAGTTDNTSTAAGDVVINYDWK